mmetsp:Transcript_23943/g.74819  ORF Transcript_23943/g.74819 Transcript_23943/m.74819 type:complete len:112 (+) Transcript_23943:1-336(+)
MDCELCGGRSVSRAPKERGRAKKKHEARAGYSRNCMLPYFDVNFDHASVAAGLAEKCRVNRGYDLKSCYLEGGLNATIRVDAASVAAFDAYRAAHRGGTCAHDRLARGSYN